MDARRYKHAFWLLIGFGITLRVAQYLYNRSLWLDEAKLAANLMERSPLELLSPLQSAQGAPWIFLLGTKLLMELAGSGEYVLRFIPLVFGILSLFLFYSLASKILDVKPALIAVALFTISDRLIYYSSELKQYSVDVAVTLCVFLIFLRLISAPPPRKRALFLGAVGAVAIWISHPAVFILAGISLYLAALCLKRSPIVPPSLWAVISLIWLASVAISYNLSLHNLTQNSDLQNYWSAGFMPFPPATFEDAAWLLECYLKIFRDPLAYPLFPIPAFLFLAGCLSMYQTKRQFLAILLSGAPFLLAASALKLFPLEGRMLLFIVPSMIIIVSQGIIYLFEKTAHRRVLRAASIALVCFMTAQPAAMAAYHLTVPRQVEEIKPVLEYVKSHRDSNELIYVYHAATRALKYYGPRFGFREHDYIWGVKFREDPTHYFNQIDSLKIHGRMWFLISHSLVREGRDEAELILQHLNRVGHCVRKYEARGARVYLYEFV